jgi:hypothetical protein
MFFMFFLVCYMTESGLRFVVLVKVNNREAAPFHEYEHQHNVSAGKDLSKDNGWQP